MVSAVEGFEVIELFAVIVGICGLLIVAYDLAINGGYSTRPHISTRVMAAEFRIEKAQKEIEELRSELDLLKHSNK